MDRGWIEDVLSHGISWNAEKIWVMPYVIVLLYHVNPCYTSKRSYVRTHRYPSHLISMGLKRECLFFGLGHRVTGNKINKGLSQAPQTPESSYRASHIAAMPQLKRCGTLWNIVEPVETQCHKPTIWIHLDPFGSWCIWCD